jgi:DNA-binding cell septation regulator SpoVG
MRYISKIWLSTKLKIVNEEINIKMQSRNEEKKKFDKILKPIREKSRDKEIEHLIPRLLAATEEYKNELEKDMLKIGKKIV